MPKIMLVEDDKSLREIYSIRLVAEGYDVVSAGDGEEALAIAVQQKPDLILSDVMMPKISGFDMLDILRSTPETKDIKVIMMTALSSEEQRQRGESLGADKYLVKSQVGIEDVINAVHEVMNDKAGAASAQTAANSDASTPPTSASTEAASGAQTVAAQPVSSTESAASTQATAPANTTATESAPSAGPVASPSSATEQAQPAEQTQASEQAQPAPQQSSTAAEMEALLNESSETPNANWPGTSAQ